jgi:hypothetical protein
LEWRSGIASWYAAQQIQPHTYTPVAYGYSYENGVIVHTAYHCGVCDDTMYGMTGDKMYTNEDLNVLNFERIKWGGIRLGCLIYTLFDLEQFQKEEVPEPTEEDITLFRAILRVAETSELGDYPSALRKRLADVPGLRTTKNEIDRLMEILACIGVLKPASYERPSRGKHDWTYMEFWRGEDKYDKTAVEQYFGEYL